MGQDGELHQNEVTCGVPQGSFIRTLIQTFDLYFNPFGSRTAINANKSTHLFIIGSLKINCQATNLKNDGILY